METSATDQRTAVSAKSHIATWQINIKNGVKERGTHVDAAAFNARAIGLNVTLMQRIQREHFDLRRFSRLMHIKAKFQLCSRPADYVYVTSARPRGRRRGVGGG